jgi:hypothetical protein
MTWLKIGQTFALNNCDYYVLADEWVIVDIDYPIVTFSVLAYKARANTNSM